MKIFWIIFLILVLDCPWLVWLLSFAFKYSLGKREDVKLQVFYTKLQYFVLYVVWGKQLKAASLEHIAILLISKYYFQKQLNHTAWLGTHWHLCHYPGQAEKTQTQNTQVCGTQWDFQFTISSLGFKNVSQCSTSRVTSPHTLVLQCVNSYLFS